MQRKLTLYATIAALLCHSFAQASENPATRGYTWSFAPATSLPFSATLIDDKNSAPTSIQYGWNAQGALVLSSPVDNNLGLIAPLPQRTLWMPHPAQAASLESKFLTIARGLGYPYPTHPYLEKNGSSFRVRDFAEDLRALDSLKPTLTFDQHVRNIRASVAATRVTLMGRLTGLDEKFLVPAGTLSQMVDVVEPLASFTSEPSEAHRFDAFSLLPSKELFTEPDAFLALLSSVAAQPTWEPIPWFFLRTDVPEQRRLAILSLVTHNHVSEENFIRSVILLRGVRPGWEAFRNLNRLYESERETWLQRGELQKDPTLPELLGKSNIPFINALMAGKVKPILRATNPGAEWIPLYRTYHYYGAFIVARLMRRLFVPRALGLKFSEFLGSQYKKATNGENSPQLAMIRTVYRQGAEDGYRHDVLPLSTHSKEHLAIIVSGRRGPGWFRNLSERTLAKLIERNMGSRYNTVRVWTEESGRDPSEFLRETVRGVGSGEHLDVFTVQHGPEETFVPQLTAAQVEAIVPKGMIRNLISSGCSMWGKMKLDGGQPKTLWRSGFGAHMKTLAVHSYLIFANDSAYWWRLSSELSSRLGPASGWTDVETEFLQMSQRQLSKKPKSGVLREILYPGEGAFPILGMGESAQPTDSSRWSPWQNYGDGFQEFLFLGTGNK
jgi:hypothetical protein